MNTFIALALVAFVLVGGGGLLISIYNRLVMLRHGVDKAFANIDVLLKQRVDELPELVKVVKASVEYERETLMRLTALRTAFLNSTDREDKVALANQLDGALKSLFAVAENYPALRANRSFTQLQKRISELEDQIADRREFFNESVTLYNVGIAEFPNLILARLLHYTPCTLLQIHPDETRYAGIAL